MPTTIHTAANDLPVTAMRLASCTAYRNLCLGAAAAAAMLVACAPEGELPESATLEWSGDRIGTVAPGVPAARQPLPVPRA